MIRPIYGVINSIKYLRRFKMKITVAGEKKEYDKLRNC